jgi:hypothetical protein
VDRLALAVEENAQELTRIREEQRTQFKRFAQMQAELDSLKHPRHALTPA